MLSNERIAWVDARLRRQGLIVGRGVLTSPTGRWEHRRVVGLAAPRYCWPRRIGNASRVKETQRGQMWLN